LTSCETVSECSWTFEHDLSTVEKLSDKEILKIRKKTGNLIPDAITHNEQYKRKCRGGLQWMKLSR
jgi:hypothetical protein